MNRYQYKRFPLAKGTVKSLNSDLEAQLPDSDRLNKVSDNTTTDERELDRSLAGYDYQLPQARIAQNPAFPRDSSRLLVVSPTHHTHQIFRDLPSWLKPGDLLVMNNTRVIPARLYGRKPSGALVTVLLLEERQNNTWLALAKPGKRLQSGTRIFLKDKTVQGG